MVQTGQGGNGLNFPGAGDTVTIPGNAEIHLSQNTEVQSITIQGAVAATLVFDSTATLTVDGAMTLSQTSGGRTSLTVQTNNGTGVAGTINAHGYSVSGALDGTSGLTVSTHVSMTIATSVDTTHYASDLGISGSFTAQNTTIGGPDAVSGGSSTVTVYNGGTFATAALGLLQIGGNGVAVLNDSGTTTADSFDLLNLATTTVNGGVLTIHGNMAVGNRNLVPTAYTSSTGAISGTGAILTVKNAGTLNDSTATLNISGGDGVKVTVDSASHFNAASVIVGPGDKGKSAPDFVMSSVAVHITGDLTVGKGYVSGTDIYKPGTLEIHNSSTVKIDGALSVVTMGTLNPVELLIDGGSTVEANFASVGVTTAGPGLGNVNIDLAGGTGAKLTVDTLMTVGDGHSVGITSWLFSSFVHVHAFTSLVVTTALVKAPYGLIYGSGTISAPLLTHGIFADLIPGEYFTFDGSGGSGTDPSNDDAFGTMTVDGNLDATLGMTLDEIFEDAGENSSLNVTGNADLGTDSELRIGLASGADPTTTVSSYAAGATFTLLTADGGITGEFANLPEGTYVGEGLLPKLAGGLKWDVAYTGSAVTATVIAMPTANVDVWIATYSPDSGYYFDNSANWSLGRAPESNEVAEFDGEALVDIRYATTLAGIIIKGNDVNFGLRAQLTVNGDILIEGNNIQTTMFQISGDSDVSLITENIVVENAVIWQEGGNIQILDNLEINENSIVDMITFENNLSVGGFTFIGTRGQFLLQGSSNVVASTGTLIVGGTEIGTGIEAGEVLVDNGGTLNSSTAFDFGSWIAIDLDAGVSMTSTWNVGQVLVANAGELELGGGRGGAINADSIIVVDGSTFDIYNSGFSVSGETCTISSSLLVDSNSTFGLLTGATILCPDITLEGSVAGNFVIPEGLETSPFGITVNGAVSLMNTLTVIDTSDYAVEPYVAGDFLTLISARFGISGEFSNITGLPSLDSGFSWHIYYSADAVIAEVVGADMSFTPSGSSVSLTAGASGTVVVSDGTKSLEIPTSGLQSLTLNLSGETTVVVDPSAGSAAFTLVISGGTAEFNTDAGAAAPNMTIEASNGAVINFNCTQHLYSLSLDAGTKAVMTQNGNNVLVVGTLSIAGYDAPTATLDLMDNGLIAGRVGTAVSDLSTNIDVVYYALESGRNDGAWSGMGITSSVASTSNAAAGFENYSIGYEVITNTAGTTFMGEIAVWMSIAVRFTLSGDANLDGVVDPNDFDIVASNYGASGMNWTDGSLDYSGIVDATSLGYVQAEMWESL